ncbi:hypothetical protein [Caulobacter sp. 17J65-9]|uniref:hypothetical protein n=1 Tax=Caulobacter sp. 17J65-9 TaxID=2709382 RepID=UPI0013C754E9|nr:hypothetical protein [Caulobacter sp. 17J65-9]NEX93132.1 hypothetical protein [Caulobacter sp. 17J65-9]
MTRTILLILALALAGCSHGVKGAAQTQSALANGLSWTYSDAGGVEVLTYTGPGFEPLALTITCALARTAELEISHPQPTAPEGPPRLILSSGKTKTTLLATESKAPDGTRMISAMVNARDPVMRDFRATGALTVGEREIVVNSGTALPEIRKFFDACGG